MATSRLLLISMLISSSQIIYSQGIKGKVTDRQGNPVADVHIFNIASGDHAHSSSLGTFKLSNTSRGDSIRVSHVGYRSQSFIITDAGNEIEIILEESSVELNQVVITGDVKSFHQISRYDIKNDPVNSSQEILRKVPGLFIGQHAGGGKAEQIFLRGFDIDHGTDINISADGVPVNMVSHAHGQGYADLHFLIPESIKEINYGKGSYYADKGNLCTAGYVEFITKDKLDDNVFTAEYGAFNTVRMVTLFNLLGDRKDRGAYIAAEHHSTDGPFDSPQNFNRLNLLAKYTAMHDNQKLSIQASRFQSKWDASGQIPQRAVDRGLIGRFGAIDDTEGGNTSRTSLQVNHTRMLNDNTIITSKTWFVHYDFELYSNFTFFLNDPVNGDQIRQRESRNMTGFESQVFHRIQSPSFSADLHAGAGLRYDDINGNELSHSLNRETTLERFALGNIDETNMYAFVTTEMEFGKWLINPGVRFDFFTFDYVDLLQPAYATRSASKGFASPKLNIIYTASPAWQVYAKSGVGFHSNDTRVITEQAGRDILPAAYGTDAGINWKPSPRLFVNAALWHLFLQQEFVYVGDEGIIEPSGRTSRSGTDISIRYEFNTWLFAHCDVNYAYARSIDDPEGQNYIPLAPDLTSTTGISFQHPRGINASIRNRILRRRPANEDYSITAKGYSIADLTINYERKNWQIGLIVENLFNRKWNETQFATLSRLDNEPEGVDEIHLTPGYPFFMKMKVGLKF